MHKSFRWRLTGNFSLITAVFLTISLIVSYFIFKDFYFTTVEENLTNQALLVADMVESSVQDGDISPLNQLSKKIAGDTNTRVTIVDSASGNVLADSEFDSASMDPHKNRPEIYKALNGEIGADIRFSNTAQINMLYVAVPFKTDQLSGVVRLSKPLNEIETVLFKILSVLLLTIFLTGIAAFTISAVVANRLSRPLSDITQAVKNIAQGNFSRRVPMQTNEELSVLSSAVNSMAEYLEQYLNQISEVKSQLEAVLDNTVNGILMVDLGGRINYVNPVAREFLFPDKDPSGRKHAEVINNYELIEIIDRIRNHPQVINTSITLYSLGNKIIDISALPVSTVRGSKNDNILVVMNDITEIKRLEQVRKDFIANVTHELKTPVSSISGFAETMLSEKVDNREEVLEFSQIIYNEAKRLTELIDSLFELSRLESADPRLNFLDMDLAAVIEETIKLMEKRTGAREQKIQFNKPDQPVIIKADANSVVQILINLLDNAIKHSQSNEPVEVILEENLEEIAVTVIDKGEGIPAKDLPRVFERFYRVDQTRSRKTGGSGLGLAIVKHLVETHGGRVGVKSSPGKGAKFYFTLPRQE